MDPESTGLNPAWRESLAYTIIGTTWQDGASLTEINATRQLLIQDMEILEGIAPESGAYFNEVSHPRITTILQPTRFLFLLSGVCRLRDTNSTGRNPSSAPTMMNSEPLSRNTIQNPCSSFTKVSDQTSGTQISSARSEATSKLPRPLTIAQRGSPGGLCHHSRFIVLSYIRTFLDMLL